MDHLPIFSDDFVPPQVPHLRRYHYDGRGSANFLERVGLTEADLRSRRRRELQPPGTAESCVQEWLFFGVLHDVTKLFELPIDLTKFTSRAPNGAALITMRPLIDYAARLVMKQTQGIPKALVQRSSVDAKSAVLRALFELKAQTRLHELPWPYVAAVSEYLGDQTRNMEIGSNVKCIIDSAFISLNEIYTAWVSLAELHQLDLKLSVLSSIALLLETLEIITRRCFGRVGIGRHAALGFHEPWRHRMLQQGWCPSHIEVISQIDTTLIYVASQLRSYDQRDHSACEYERCIVESHSIYNAGPTHDADTCSENCQILAVDEEKVVSILAEGSFPVILLKYDGCHPRLDVTDVRHVKTYIVISHVWAHGLGNPKMNALHSCQTLKLFRSIAEANGDNSAIWIDSFCVPVSEYNKPFRKLAIQKLKVIYASAPMVLILDERLQKAGLSSVERKIKFLCSEWLRRLWTFQEGYLPKIDQIYVKFRDNVAQLNSIMSLENTGRNYSQVLAFDQIGSGTRSDASSDQLVHDLENNLACIIQGFFLKNSNQYQNKLLKIVKALHGRTTTHIADEAICLATLMDIPLEQFPGFPTMEQVLSKLELPQDLLFAPGRRLTAAPLSWAPQSFLEAGVVVYFSPAIGELSEQGLIVQKACILFEDKFRLRPGGRIVIKGTEDHIDYAFITPDLNERLNSYGEVKTLESAMLVCAVTRETPKRKMRAVMVSNATAEGDRIYCKYEFWVNLRFFGPEESYDTTGKPYEILYGVYLDPIELCVF